MADVDLTLLIDAEDRTQKVFDDAKKRVTDLEKIQTDANTKIAASTTQLANGQQQVNIKASAYLAIVKQAKDASDGLVVAHKKQEQALRELERAHQRLVAAQNQMAAQQKRAMDSAGESLMGYIRGFAGIAGVVQIVRTSIAANAEFERGMTRIRMEGGAVGNQLTDMQQKFHVLAQGVGKDTQELMGNFRSFRDAIGGSGGSGLNETFETFKRIEMAAHGAGVSFETLGKAAVEAIKVMHVPMTEIEQVLDTWVNTIPSSMMQQWNQASTGIIGSLKDIGYTGTEAAKVAGAAFGNVAHALGDAGRAGQLLQAVLDKSTDTSTAFGRSMIGHVQQMGSSTQETAGLLDKSYEQLKAYGVFSDNLSQRDMARRTIARQFSAQQLRDLEEAVLEERKIQEEHKKTGEGVDNIRRRYALLKADAKGAMDSLIFSAKELYTEIGKALGGDLIAQFSRDLRKLAQEIKDVARWWGMTPLERIQQRQNEQAAGIGRLGPLEGGARPTGMDMDFDPWTGAAKPAGPALRPFIRGVGTGGRGRFATGGAFAVEGKGGIDQQPVGFMATPGERVAVTTPQQESLQQQQDKADIAMREHFARFHDQKRKEEAWWPSSSVRAPGAGGMLSGGGGTASPRSGPPGGGDGPNNKPATDPPNTTTSTPFDPRTGYDPKYPGNAPAGQTPSLIGPFGQVMPAWGAETTDPGGKYWGGGTGGGAAGGVAGIAGGPSGRALTKEERAAQADRGPGGGGTTSTTGTAGAAGSLAEDRIKYASLLATNPELREKILKIAVNEQGGNAQGTQAVIESLFNRASYTGNSLAKEARWAKTEAGYYDPRNHTMTPAERAVAEKALDAALKGGNISNYGTDNASEGNSKFASRRIAKDMYRATRDPINGEYFMSPGKHSDGPGIGNFNKYQAWLARVKGGTSGTPGTPPTTSTPNAQPPATGGTGTGPGSPMSGELLQGVGAERKAYSNVGAHSHKGFDVRATDGTPVYAEGDGVVVKHEFQPGAVGGIVTIKYNDGTTAKYMHLSNWNQKGVETNQPIKAGTVLGLSGRSPGAPETPHLHVEYYDTKTGKLIDPAARHGWGVAGAGGEGLRGRVVFAGIKGSFPKGTTREEALRQSGATASATPNQPDNKPAAAPTNVAHGLPGGPSGRALTKEERAAQAKPPDKPPDNKPATAPTSTKKTTTKKATGQKTSDATPATKPVVEAGSAGPPSGVGHAQWGATARAGRPLIVGEDGPETFVPNEPGKILPEGRKRTQGYNEWENAPAPPGYGTGSGLPRAGRIQEEISKGTAGWNTDPDLSEGWQDRERYGPGYRPGDRFNTQTGKPLGQGINYEDAIRQHQDFTRQISQPVRAQVEMPRAGPIRQRMSRHVEAQRERDVGRMTRHASNSDIGFV